MNISCLNIRQEYARIDIKNQNATLDIRSKMGELNINTQPAVLDINTEEGGLEIDCYPCRYSMGIKNSEDYMRDEAEKGMQAIRDFTARIVSYTRQVAESPAKSSATIADNAASNNRGLQPASWLTLKYIDPPQYNYTPDDINISYQTAEVNTEVTPKPVENNTQAGSPSISMAQYQNIRLWVSEGKFDINA